MKGDPRVVVGQVWRAPNGKHAIVLQGWPDVILGFAAKRHPEKLWKLRLYASSLIGYQLVSEPTSERVP